MATTYDYLVTYLTFVELQTTRCIYAAWENFHGT